MSWIPGWESIAAAEWWSGFYFWLSISCLIGLGITEVASHRYGERKDELVAIEQGAKDKRHDEDMAQLQHDTAQTNERAAQLSREAALADARAAQSQLELQRLKNPRSIMPDELKAELADKPKGTATVLYVKECSDCEWLAYWLVAGLQQSGWALTNTPTPLPPAPVSSVLSSSAAAAGGQAWGVSVIANTNADGSAQSALMWAVIKLLGENGHGGVDKALPDGFVRVIVAPRP